MADTEEAPEPQFSTLKERIAALNQQKNFNSEDKPRKPAPPPPPGRPVTAQTRSHTAPAPSLPPRTTTPSVPARPVKKAAPPPLPRRDTQTSQDAPQEQRAAPPPLPSRANSSTLTPPVLPSRTSQSSLNNRRGSASSEVSQRSTNSAAPTVSSVTSQGSDGRKLPPTYNKGSLPPLPPTRREREAREQEEAQRPTLRSVKSSASVSSETAPKPGLPPRLPSRPAPKTQPSNGSLSQREIPDHLKSANVTGFNGKPLNRTSQHDVPAHLKAAKVIGFGGGKASPRPQQLKKTASQPPPLPQNARDDYAPPPPLPQNARDDDAPPPIPTTSRPSATQIDQANARVLTQNEVKDDCWTCRDWSGPDDLAAQFPRQSLPRGDPVGHLAQGLCGPFPSYTDKARAIFTWFHYNIHYDTVSFFGKCVKHHSVEETIFSGLAVCQGYAEVYKAIANRAGLDCVLVSGHGKGFGHSALKKGERPPPPKPDGHAWNAVRIDGGEWHLLDACWGAGHLDTSTNSYKQKFSPKQFTRTNDQFGESHFPKEARYQFRDDGRTISWEEYFIGRTDGEPPVFYSNGHSEGILESSVEPKERQISVHSGEIVRFQFSKLCEHWRSETHGKGQPPLLLLSIHGVDGRKDDMVPIETDGYWHWVDVHARDLGAPGQSVQVAQITTMAGQDARGVTAKEYFAKKGKVGMAWAYVMKWDLV